MGAGIVFRLVKPVGGREKAEAVKDAAKKTNAKLSEVLYVGDSITDVEAFKLVRENGGLTISFNGNEYAVRNAEVVVMSENNFMTAVIAELFSKLPKQAALRVLENWSHETLRQAHVGLAILEKLSSLYPAKLPKVQIVTTENMDLLVRESCEFRKRVRGEAVGRLG